MSKRLLVVLANRYPESPEKFSAPLFQVMVAAIPHRIEVISTALAGIPAIAGHACTIILDVRQVRRNVYDVIEQARKARVTLRVCTSTLGIWIRGLIEEIDEPTGAAFVFEEAVDNNTVTFPCRFSMDAVFHSR